MKGIVKQTRNNIQSEKVELLPSDIYRFIRKYHKKIWLYLTFIQRLFSLNNPINELIGFWQTRKVKRIDLFETHYKYNDYMDYDSLEDDYYPCNFSSESFGISYSNPITKKILFVTKIHTNIKKWLNGI